MSMGEAEVASSECTHPTLCDLDGQNETSVVELGGERQRDESELAQRFTSRVELGDGREGRRRKLDHPESNLVVASQEVPGPLNGIEHHGDQTVVDEVQPVQTAPGAAYAESDIAALDAEPPPQQAKKQRALPFNGVLLEPLEAIAARVSSSSGAQEAPRLPVGGRTSDPGSALPANVQLPSIAAPEPGPSSSPLGMPSSGTSSGTATNLDELLQLIRGHPDSDAAVAAALNAVQRLKRAAPSSSAGSQPGGAAKRAATHAAHADALAAQLVQLGAQLPLLADSPNEEVASGVDKSNTSGVDRSNTSAQPTLSDAAASDMSAPSGKQQAFTLGADEHPMSTSGRAGQVQSTGVGGQHGEGKLKKARSKASADPAGPAGAQSASASAALPTVPPTSTTAQEVQVKGGLDNATPSATMSSIPDMATYLNEYPMCKRLVEIVRSTPNNSTKTPLALVNEYAARLTLEVVWGEDADTPAGPYTATCTLRGRSGTADHAQGSGRGRNKRDARQVAAAACVEVLLGPTHGVTLMDLAAPLRPPTASVRVRDAAKPGLGYQGASTNNATANKFGSKKRRDEDLLNSPRQPSISGGSQGGGPGGVRPVSFTRGHQQTHQQQQPPPPQQVSSSVPAMHGRREPEPMYREKPLTAASVSIGGSRPFATAQQRSRAGGRMSPAHPAHMGGGVAAPDHTSWQQFRPPMNPYNPGAAFNGADMGSGTRTGYHAGSRGMSHDAASSSFGMHSLQAILPAASDVIAGLHKRDNTAMLNSGGGGMGGALGALQAGLTGGPLDLSGLHGTLDALHSAAQVLPTNTWQDAAARAGIAMPDYAAAAMAAASAAAKLSQWTGSQSTQPYNLPSSYQQQQPQHQSQHQSYSPPLLGADRQGGMSQSADGGHHTSGTASHVHAGYGSNTSGYGSNAGMRDTPLLGGTSGLGTGLTNTNNTGTYGGVGGIGPGSATGGTNGSNLANASDQVASGGWSPWSLWGPSGTGVGQPASWAGDGQ